LGDWATDTDAAKKNADDLEKKVLHNNFATDAASKIKEHEIFSKNLADYGFDGAEPRESYVSPFLGNMFEYELPTLMNCIK
jgi:hypothetical protein